MRLVSLWILYATHLNDNSLFCVLTSLYVICSPNSLFRGYLDSLNRYIVLRYYKALLGILERNLVPTEPLYYYQLLWALKGFDCESFGRYRNPFTHDVTPKVIAASSHSFTGPVICFYPMFIFL
jgi:hypothetical protein